MYAGGRSVRESVWIIQCVTNTPIETLDFGRSPHKITTRAETITHVSIQNNTHRQPTEDRPAGRQTVYSYIERVAKGSGTV